METKIKKKKGKKVHYLYINLVRFIKAVVHTSLMGESFCIKSSSFFLLISEH